MTIVLHLPDEIGERAREEAQKRSQGLEEFLVDVVSSSISMPAQVQRSLKLLDSIEGIGDEQDQRETFEILQRSEAEDSLSVRRRFV